MTGSATAYAFFVLLFTAGAALLLLADGGQAAFISKRMEKSINAKERILDPKKRPFCNAFTGCGLLKRSNLPALTSDGELVDESLGSLLELNAEPAVEDLSRQIMSEAKLWEAIQEANVELNRRRQESAEGAGMQQDDASVYSPTGGAATCALPPCYI